ncbi:MAG: hypothetical protein AAFX06_25540 [Planctomycetota bacterium]
MSPQENLARRKDLRRQIASLEQQISSKRAELDICEMDAGLDLLLANAGRPASAPTSETESFIAKYGDQFEPHYFEFLEQEYRGTADVLEFWGIKESTFRRKIKQWTEPDVLRGGSGNYRFKTISIVRQMIHVDSETEG